ncbi:hypothetical protein ACLOJK_016226 [Asimina triloba]
MPDPVSVFENNDRGSLLSALMRTSYQHWRRCGSSMVPTLLFRWSKQISRQTSAGAATMAAVNEEDEVFYSGVVFGTKVTATETNKCHAAHMIVTILTAIFQGSMTVLIYTRIGDFLGELRSYVREDDGAMILRLVGGLCVPMFCLEWVIFGLAFALRYYAKSPSTMAPTNCH